MLTRDDRVNPRSNVVVTELENHHKVLLHLDTKQYYSLNPTGVHIWTLLAPERTLGEVSQALTDAFDVSAERAEQSVLALVSQLHAEKLVDRIDG